MKTKIILIMMIVFTTLSFTDSTNKYIHEKFDNSENTIHYIIGGTENHYGVKMGAWTLNIKYTDELVSNNRYRSGMALYRAEYENGSLLSKPRLITVFKYRSKKSDGTWTNYTKDEMVKSDTDELIYLFSEYKKYIND